MVKIFDSTLRDGAQAEGISFSVDDKLKIVAQLDELGISYIEAGNPSSNPKDLEFFDKIKKTKLQTAKLVAFGSTRRKNEKVEEDKNVLSLLSAETEAVAIFGKSWDFHVTEILRASLEENIAMIEDTISFLKSKGKEVIYDAEHFFDGYFNNKEYALLTLQAAKRGGADALVLCDTNGGTFPTDVYNITKEVLEKLNIPVGIHCHNDCGMAVANSLMAVEAGATQVQGTYIGFGERCGNANLSTIIPNLQIKKNIQTIPPENIQKITSAAIYISEIANISLSNKEPYVGACAFAHKGGMHIDGVTKASRSFEHIDPQVVGNERKFLLSEVSGRTTIISKIQKIDASITKDSPKTDEIIKLVKQLEHEGYQFEASESTLELFIRKKLGKYKPFFQLERIKIVTDIPTANGTSASALIKVIVDGKEEITAAEGEGPVNALDKALRKALEVFYPALKDVRLIDYKVRVLGGQSATASKVRVLIESTDGHTVWSNVGVSADIIEASWIALVDSIECKLILDIEHKFKAFL